jgi:hypothetical protein
VTTNEPNSEKTRRYAILRAYGSDRLNRIIDRRIRDGGDLATIKGLTKAEREYCVMVLHASVHAGTMTAGERAAYHKARAWDRARLAHRRKQ